MTALDREYLSRPLLDVKYEISENVVKVQSAHTCYANVTRIQRVLKQDVLELYTEVLRLAKSKGVKIAYTNRYKHKINTNWEKYREEFKYYNEVFDKVIEKYKEVEERGLHSGTSDDKVLEAAIRLRWDYEKCYHRTSTISLIRGIHRELQHLYSALQSQHQNVYKIYL